MTVTYMSPLTDQPTTVTGVEVEGRYPHMYVYVELTRGHVLRIPHELVCEVSR